MTNIILLLTNIWVTTATLTPHYNGESNFNSAIVWIQRADWLEKRIEILHAEDGQKISEREVTNIVVKLIKPDTEYVPGRPFWLGGYLWQFVPTNAPPPLDTGLVPLRYIRRQDMPPIPQPPLPPNFPNRP